MLVPMAVLRPELRAGGPAGAAPRWRCRRPRPWSPGRTREPCRSTSTGVNTRGRPASAPRCSTRDGTAIGPDPAARTTAGHRGPRGPAGPGSTTSATAPQILVPVSLGGSSTLPASSRRWCGSTVREPRARVRGAAGLADPRRRSAWCCSCGAVVLADRLGRSFVRPIAAWPARRRRLGEGDRRADPGGAGGAARGAGARRGAQPARRPDRRAARSGSAEVSRTSPTGCARRSPRCGCASSGSATPRSGTRLRATSTSWRAWSTTSCARPVARSGRGSSRAATRWRCSASGPASGQPLAEDQGRAFEVVVPDGPIPVVDERGRPRRAARRPARQRLHAHPRGGRGPRRALAGPGRRGAARRRRRRVRATRPTSTSPTGASAAAGRPGSA